MQKFSFLSILCIFGCLLHFQLQAETRNKGKGKKAKVEKAEKKETKKKSAKDKAKKKVDETPLALPEPPPPPRPEEKITVSLGPSQTGNQLNAMFGIHVVKGSALLTGMQFGHRVFKKSPLFLGVEYNFSLYSPGSILGILGGGWYEFPLEGGRGPTLAVGLVAGSGFTTDVIATPTTVVMGFLDLAFSQPMDDLFDLRVQLRPGVMHRYLAFMMNLSIAFRFA